MIIKYEETRVCEIELAEYWEEEIVEYAKENNCSLTAAVSAVLSDNEDFIEDYDGALSDMDIDYVSIDLVKA